MDASYTIVVALRRAPAAAGDVPGHEFLLIRNAKRGGKWELPGGRCEPGEEPLSCARREFLEETGHRLGSPQLVQRRSTALGEGFVFVGSLGEKSGDAESATLEARFVDRLPGRERLAFPDDPYDALFAAVRDWARPRTGPEPSATEGSGRPSRRTR